MDKKLISKEEGDAVEQAVGYIRCATNGVDVEEPVEAQKAVILSFAEEHGVKVGDWYVNLGYSGTNLEKPELQALLDAAQEPDCGFGMVLLHGWSRLSRRVADLREIGTTLSASEIRLVSVTQGEYGPVQATCSRSD